MSTTSQNNQLLSIEIVIIIKIHVNVNMFSYNWYFNCLLLLNNNNNFHVKSTWDFFVLFNYSPKYNNDNVTNWFYNYFISKYSS